MKAAAMEGLSCNGAYPLAERLACAQQAIKLLREVIAQLEEEIEAEHVFDETSVVNPATGKPYGPGPLWAGTEPMDYPDPHCVCTAPWIEDGTPKGHCGRREYAEEQAQLMRDQAGGKLITADELEAAMEKGAGNG